MRESHTRGSGSRTMVPWRGHQAALLFLTLCFASQALAGSYSKWGWVEISCNNYPESSKDGELLNADADGKPPHDCEHVSNIFATVHGEDADSDGYGHFPPDEQARIESEATKAFLALGKLCMRMSVRIPTLYDSLEDASARRDKWIATCECKSKCIEFFEFNP